MPIYLFAAYKKSSSENISAKDKILLYKVIKQLVKIHKENKHHE